MNCHKITDASLNMEISAYAGKEFQLTIHGRDVHAALVELKTSRADLDDANHALLLANSNAAAFQRVAEQRQGEIERLRRAVEWFRTLSVFQWINGKLYFEKHGSFYSYNPPDFVRDAIDYQPPGDRP